ncbi:hypothetical protein [Gilvibacter sediminis]|uniref:hypothetical protein n=1 Tax=Gilvibacter sediminis TaxID=379071 RepID=UPI00235084F6|nr:hypothetical protein [Gilvibacter sediminis]MDC7996910.1 hypothetical protein [Gilvibacter sediminis]
MKYILSLLLVATLCGCIQNTEKPAIAITILADRTDTIIPPPQPGMVKEIVERNSDKNARVVFRFQNIGNTDYNSTYVIRSDGHSLLDNELIAQAEQQEFYEQIDSLIIKENGKQFTYNTSSIFVPLAHQLRTIKNETAKQKVIVLFSDLGEISDIYNILIAKNRSRILEDPQVVAVEIRRQLNIVDLSGVQLYIVNFPKTREQNRIFSAMCAVLQEVFNDSGLEIHIGMDQQLSF